MHEYGVYYHSVLSFPLLTSVFEDLCILFIDDDIEPDECDELFLGGNNTLEEVLCGFFVESTALLSSEEF